MYPARPIREMRTPPIFIVPIITSGRASVMESISKEPKKQPTSKPRLRVPVQAEIAALKAGSNRILRAPAYSLVPLE